jgi:para-aminobenzoate synthetase / 4-amino-4-deoxychorismate lyase
VLRALFPCGSVTGAPKVRTMEIIAGLEEAPRGVYTGAIGFYSPGEAVFNVPIRTLVIERESATVRMGVGSGVTYDSEAESEYRECLQKAAFTHHPVRAFELLETMLLVPGEEIFLLEEHLARLAGSARYFGFQLDVREARARLGEASAAAGAPLRLRLLASRAGGIRLESAPFVPIAGPLRATVADEPVDSRDVMLYHKTTWRRPYDERLARHPGFDEVILRNERGEATEFVNGNLVVRRGDQHCTPPIECGLLPGTFRARLIREGKLIERVLLPGDLREADAIFRINGVQKWTPVTLRG